MRLCGRCWQDPYGEETETEEGDEEGRGATDVTIVSDAKRLVVCKKTGETTLHKAARLGYEVPTTYGVALAFSGRYKLSD